MEHNPYTPPQAKIESPFAREAVPRPIAVWLVIVCLVSIVLFFAVLTAQSIGATASHRGEIRSPGLLVISLVWRLLLIALFAAAAYSIYVRHGWGRWFGVTLFVALGAFTIFRPDTTYYANGAERAGGHMARFVLMPLLLAWLVYAFAFSAKAKRYFSKPSVDAP